MPITPTYQVKCDICFGTLDGYFDTREEAEQAREEAGWQDGYNTTICLEHPRTAV